MWLKIVKLKKPLTVYKKVRRIRRVNGSSFWSVLGLRAIVEMRVPAGARIGVPVIHGPEPLSAEYMRVYEKLSTEEGKCRVERAKVVSRAKHRENDELISCSDSFRKLEFIVGQTVRPLNGFDLGGEQCSAGIHCFLTRGKAHRYEI